MCCRPANRPGGRIIPAPHRVFIMLLWLLRCAYAALLLGMAVFAVNVFYDAESPTKAILAGIGILAFGGLVLFTDVKERQKQITTISAIYFGLLLGLLLGYLFSMALLPLFENFGHDREKAREFGRILVTVVCCYVTI